MIPKPWSIQLEVVEGCNRRCWFCGIRAIRGAKHDYRYMGLPLVQGAFEQINRVWGHIRVEINNHGEPTLHPNLPEIIRTIRNAAPKVSIQVQTNGEPWAWNKEEYMDELFGNGLNVLAIDTYKPGFGDEMRAVLAEYSRVKGIPWVDYYRSPPGLSANHRVAPSVKRIFLWDDITEANLSGQRSSQHRNNKIINNTAGNTDARLYARYMARLGKPVPITPMARGCTRVYREINLSWDGLIPICCLDWRNEFPIGNVWQGGLAEWWASEPWRAVRELLYRKRRDLLQPCAKCDIYTGHRAGFIVRDEGMAQKPLEELVDIVESFRILTEQSPWR